MHNSNTLTFDYVKSLVLSKGGWRSIYSSYPNLLNAMETSSTKPCPKRGAPGFKSTKFRPLKDWEITGGAHHNDEGRFLDGIEVLKWYFR